MIDSDGLTAIYATAVRVASDSGVVHKFLPTPKIKPKRRQPGFRNKTQDPHYHRDYKRTDDFKDQTGAFHKAPSKLKKWRAEQRKRLKEKFNLKKG